LQQLLFFFGNKFDCLKFIIFILFLTPLSANVDMTSLVAVVAPRTGKIIRNGLEKPTFLKGKWHLKG